MKVKSKIILGFSLLLSIFLIWYLFVKENDYTISFTVKAATGTVFPVGAYLKTAFMDYASIKLGHIDTASINSLSALTANFGTFITYADPSKPNGARRVRQGLVDTVYDDNNVIRYKDGVF